MTQPREVQIASNWHWAIPAGAGVLLILYSDLTIVEVVPEYSLGWASILVGAGLLWTWAVLVARRWVVWLIVGTAGAHLVGLFIALAVDPRTFWGGAIVTAIAWSCWVFACILTVPAALFRLWLFPRLCSRHGQEGQARDDYPTQEPGQENSAGRAH